MSWDQALYSRTKRAEAKAIGLCANCRHSPALLQRTQCASCQMASLIKEAFKYDRKRATRGSAKARGSCYVEQFSLGIRREWVSQIKEKWTGKCFYTGLDIEIGSTAGLDHMIPVSRASVFGPSRVFHPDNLVWCNRGINILKGDRTADEFLWWLRNELPVAMQSAASWQS